MQGVPEPFVVDVDGCLDLSSMQIDPKVTILNGKRALVDANGRTKRPLAELRFLFGDQTLGSLQRPFKVAKGLPLQSFNPIEPPTAFASGRGSFSLLYPVYSLAEKPEPKDVPSSSLPASRPPIQNPALATAASGNAQPFCTWPCICITQLTRCKELSARMRPKSLLNDQILRKAISNMEYNAIPKVAAGTAQSRQIRHMYKWQHSWVRNSIHV